MPMDKLICNYYNRGVSIEGGPSIGKGYMEGRAFFRPAGNFNLAVMQVDEFLDEIQPEAAATDLGTELVVEPRVYIEDVLLVVLGDADAGIANDDGRVRNTGGIPDGNPATRGRIFAGVVQQVFDRQL